MGGAGANRHLDRARPQLDPRQHLGVPVGKRHPPPRVGVRIERRRCAAPVTPPDAPPEETATKPRRRSRARKPAATPAAPEPAIAAASEPATDGNGATGSKRRRRGGRGRRKRDGFEAVLDTGDEGYGFWLDGAVRDDPVFADNWADRRAILVRIEADQIVIRPDER